MLQRGGELVGLFHASAGRSTADHHHDIALLNLFPLDGLDRLRLRDKHSHPASVAVNAIFTHHRRVDRRGLDHRSFRRDVARREADRRGQPFRFCLLRRQDHVIRLHAVLLAQALAEALTALRALPPVEVLAHCLASDGHGVQMQQAEIAQVEHHLRHAAREEGAHGRVIVRAVGQHAYQARHPAVDARPVFNVRDRAARRVGDGRNVQQ